MIIMCDFVANFATKKQKFSFFFNNDIKVSIFTFQRNISFLINHAHMQRTFKFFCSETKYN